jgi:hypothetical protein
MEMAPGMQRLDACTPLLRFNVVYFCFIFFRRPRQSGINETRLR